MPEDYRAIVHQRVLDETSFIKAVFSGQKPGEPPPWIRVVLRPVSIKGRRQIQFAYYDARRCVTKNHHDSALTENLDQLLCLPFKNIHVSSSDGETQISTSKKGRPLVSHSKNAQPAAPPVLEHDRPKDFLLNGDEPDPYLQAIGLMTRSGQVKADKQKKFKQIDAFLKLLQQTGALHAFKKPFIEVVDYGCGNAYLTFALHHYLNHVLKMPARMVGVDVRGDLLEKHAETARTLGFTDLTFEKNTICDFVPSVPPDITLALHACDTATDEALAQGIAWKSALIVSVPCCHHDLQEQLRKPPPPEAFRPVFRHGILGERMGDVLTDAFRALILRIMGYQTDVLQFISAEHTAKNVMIRAVKSDAPVPPSLIREYLTMRDYWQITPALERLLGDAFQERLTSEFAPPSRSAAH